MLDPDEPAPFRRHIPDGASPFLLTADHAGRRIPRALGTLGVSDADRQRHIGWDIGIAGVTEHLASLLDATAIMQVYSRLVIDCNRPPEVASAFPQRSEATPIPGNRGIDPAERQRRRAALFDPYHHAIATEIARRTARGQATIYIAMHSFTPVFLGQARPMHAAVLFNRNPRFSLILAALLREDPALVVAENDPYAVSDATDYGIPVHAERNDLDHTELEIRQDLIGDDAGQRDWAERLAQLLPRAADILA